MGKGLANCLFYNEPIIEAHFPKSVLKIGCIHSYKLYITYAPKEITSIIL
jgi:hypothetical protein